MTSEPRNGRRIPNGIPPIEEIRFSPAAKRWTVAIMVGLLVIFVLRIADVLAPFVWAAATAFVFNGPIKAICNRVGGRRWIGALIIFGIFFLVLVIGLFLLIPALTKEGRTLATDAPRWRTTVDQYLRENDPVRIAGIDIPADTARSTVNNVIDRVQTIAQDVGPKLLTGTFRFLIDFLLYLIATFYLMLIGGRAITHFVTTLPLKYRAEIGDLFSRANTVLSAYIRGQVLLVLIMSVSSFVILTILGVRYSLLLGIMTGVLELVPFVGPYLAIAICSIVAFFQPHGNFGLEGVALVIAAAVALFILRQIEDYGIIPNLIGKIVELPALLVIFTTVVGAALLGPMGLLLGVPIVAVIKIVVGYLYYKLVDADRTKLFLSPEDQPNNLVNLLSNQAPQSRVLVVAGPEPIYLRDPQLLDRLHTISDQKTLDLAFYCGDDEKTSDAIREAGFPITTMDQEHFPANTSR